MQKKIINGLFLLVLWVPVLAVLRSPQLWPAVKAVGNDSSEWDHQRDALRRSTPLWNGAVEVYSALLFRLGTTNARAIGIVGRDGWVFLGDLFNRNMDQALGRRVYDANEVTLWINSRKAQQLWLERRGIKMLYVVAPAKWSIYPDRLPSWMPSHTGKHTLDLLLAVKDGPAMIDLRPALKAARQDVDTYSPLNSHWTDYGALVAWRNIARRLGEMDPRLANLHSPLATGATVVDQGSEFAAMVSLPEANRWTVPILDVPLPNFEIVNADGATTSTPGGAHTSLAQMPRVTRSDKAGNTLHALVLRDSMGDAISPYVQAAFGEVVQIGHHIEDPKLAPNVPALVDRYKPDVVIYVMTERYLDILPNDLDSWLAANAYDESPVSYRDWSVNGAKGDLRLDGDPLPGAATSLYWPSGDNAAHVLRISTNASAPGKLQIQFYAEGGLHVIERTYAAGPNELYYALPAGVVNSRVSLYRPADAGTATTDAISLRRVQTE
jgi:hypothetical protein